MPNSRMSFVDVVEHVVSHLVPHHRLDLGQRAAVEQVAGEGEDGRDHARIGEPLGGVEDRHDHDRHDQREEDEKEQRDARAPDPPGLRQAADHCIEDRQREAAEDRGDQEALPLLAQPARKGEVGEAVLVLAEPVAIDGERERQHRGGRTATSLR
jgi:hypothetical protein